MAAPRDREDVRETVSQGHSLTPERFARVRAVFEAAIERGASKRFAPAGAGANGMEFWTALVKRKFV